MLVNKALLIAVLTSSSVLLAVNAGECAAGVEHIYPLIAGQHTAVGYVEVLPGSGSVRYTTTDGWCITETHLDVEDVVADIPQSKKGSPKIGHFESAGTYDPCVKEVTVSGYDGLNVCGEDMVIAAHAVVTRELALPVNVAGDSGVTMQAFHPGDAYGEPSYWDVHTMFEDTLMRFDAYCIDYDRSLSSGKNLTANLYTLDSIPPNIVDWPENLHLVNWILNQGFADGEEGYSFSDVQKAIWTLIEDNHGTAGLVDWSQDNVNAIVAAAHAANPEGHIFVPGCGDYVGLAVVPEGSRQTVVAQTTLAVIEQSCHEETAWGFTPGGEDTIESGGSSWAKYISYSCQCGLEPPTNDDLLLPPPVSSSLVSPADDSGRYLRRGV